MTSETMRQSVIVARSVQRRRFGHPTDGQTDGLITNASMTSRQVREYCRLDAAGETLLRQAVNELGLSARAHDKVLRISRTIADMEGAADIAANHLAEAVQYRRLDRKL